MQMNGHLEVGLGPTGTKVKLVPLLGYSLFLPWLHRSLAGANVVSVLWGIFMASQQVQLAASKQSSPLSPTAVPMGCVYIHKISLGWLLCAYWAWSAGIQHLPWAHCCFSLN